MRTVCLEFFGCAKEAVPAIVEIKNYIDKHRKAAARRPRAPGRALREGGGLRHQVAPPRAPAHGAHRRPRGRRRGRGGAAASRGGAHRQRARRRGLRRGLARGAQALLARPRAHRGHRQAHQRLQDQRGRGDPARAPGRVHRRHRAHQHRVLDREQAGAARRAGGVFLGRAAAATRRRATLLARRAARRACRTRRCELDRARVRGRWQATAPRDLDALFRRAAADALRLSWKTEVREPLRAHLRRRAPSRRS